MLPHEDSRTLTGGRLGVRRTFSRLTRSRALFALLVMASCGPIPPGDRVNASETIIGRARWRDRVVLLTDAPALLTVDTERTMMTRTPLRDTGGSQFKPWGLGEADGRLFTVSAFDRLFEIREGGEVLEVAKLARPVANTIDLERGMAVQPVGDASGAPLVVALDASGRLSPHPGPLRAALGLTAPEESVLNLLSCSAPPRAICWLPVVPRLFHASDVLLIGVELEGVLAPDASSVIASPERRVFEDALLDRDGSPIVLRNAPGGAKSLARFTPQGLRKHERPLDQPLRLLIASTPSGVLGISRSGRLVLVR